MNRIIDYNTRKGNDSEEQYQEMEIKITGINVDDLKYDSTDDDIVKSSYTQNNINELISKAKELENKYQSKYITTLSTNISKIMDSQEEAEKLLPKNLNEYGGYDQIKKDTASYYQYSQFKRVYFNCVTNNTKYNSSTGRIISIEFTCTNKFG